jgi:tetratricopeptide (TPR) repeat protein
MDHALLPQLTLLHLCSEAGSWRFNAPAGQRLPLDWDNLFIEHLTDLRLLLIDGPASFEQIERLLFAGLPAILTLQDLPEPQRTAFLQAFYPPLSHGAPLQEAYDAASAAVAESLSLTVLPSDPYAFWDLKAQFQATGAIPAGVYYLSAQEGVMQSRLCPVSEAPTPSASAKATILPPDQGSPAAEPIDPPHEEANEERPEAASPPAPPAEEPPASLSPAPEEPVSPLSPISASSAAPEPDQPFSILAKEAQSEEAASEEADFFDSLEWDEEMVSMDWIEEGKTEEPAEISPAAPPPVAPHATEEAEKKQPEEPAPAPPPDWQLQAEAFMTRHIFREWPKALPAPQEMASGESDTSLSAEPVGESLASVAVASLVIPLRDTRQQDIQRRPGSWQAVRVQEQATMVARSQVQAPPPEPQMEALPEEAEPQTSQREKEFIPPAFPLPENPVTVWPRVDSDYARQQRFSWRRLLGLIAAVLTLLGMVYVAMEEKLQSPELPRPSAPTVVAPAPAVTANKFKVLLLPFLTDDSCQTQPAWQEKRIRDHLRNLPESQDLGLEVVYEGNNGCPQEEEAVRRLGELHRADLVLWGKPVAVRRDSEELYLRYLVLNQRDTAYLLPGQSRGAEALLDPYLLQRGHLSGTAPDVTNWILACSYFRENQWHMALSHLEASLPLESRSAALRQLMMAQCYEGLGQRQAALIAYDASIALDPSWPNAFYQRGRFFLEEGDAPTALADFNAVLERDPGHLKAAYQREWLVSSEEAPPAEPQPKPAPQPVLTEKKPLAKPAPKNLLTQAQNLSQQGEWRQARAVFSQYLVTHPDDREALLGRGKAYEQTQMYPAALADYTHALELTPGDPTLLRQRGRLYASIGEYAKALVDYNRTIALQPDDQMTFFLRAEIKARMNKSYEALADLTVALSLKPDHLPSLHLQVPLLVETVQFNEAIATLNRIIDFAPRAVDYERRADLLLRMGQVAAAREDAQKALELDPDNQGAKALLATIEEGKQRG